MTEIREGHDSERQPLNSVLVEGVTRDFECHDRTPSSVVESSYEVGHGSK